MSANSSSKHMAAVESVATPVEKDAKESSSKKPRVWWRALLIFPAWVTVSYIASNLIIVGMLGVLNFFGITSRIPLNSAVFETVTACIMYLLTLAIVVGVPYLLRKSRWITLEQLGLQRLSSWGDIGIAPLALIVYFLCSATLTYLATHFIPDFPATSTQDVGFKALSHQYEYTLAFLTLVVIAPFAEETLFRGYLYGKLRKYIPMVPALLATSLLFAMAHLPGSGHIQWNVALDVFALSVILCLLRNITGSIWAGVLLHMLKNAIAFYLTFMSPLLFLGS